MKYPRSIQVYIDEGILKRNDEVVWFTQQVKLANKLRNRKIPNITQKGKRRAVIVKRNNQIAFLSDVGQIFYSIEDLLRSSVPRNVILKYTPVCFLHTWSYTFSRYTRVVDDYISMVSGELCSILSPNFELLRTFQNSSLKIWIDNDDVEKCKKLMPVLEEELLCKYFQLKGIMSIILLDYTSNVRYVYPINESRKITYEHM